LPVYGVPSKLNDYHTTKKDIAAGLEVNPQEVYRLESEDIYEGSKNTIKSIEVVKKKPYVPSVFLGDVPVDTSMDSNMSMDTAYEINMFN
jgi:hypothetical protein